MLDRVIVVNSQTGKKKDKNVFFIHLKTGRKLALFPTLAMVLRLNLLSAMPTDRRMNWPENSHCIH